MEFFKVVESRRSVRAYSPELIEEEKLKKILEAINLAPSAGNLQSYEVVMVKEPAQKKKLTEACMGQSFIGTAPVVLVFCINPARASRYSQRGKDLYSVRDATIACAQAHLAATALGLGSCWIGAFDAKKAAEVINAPFGNEVVAILPIGYPAREARPTGRRKLSELVKEERF